MSNPFAVLLLPSENFKGVLLKEGLCGARPSLAWKWKIIPPNDFTKKEEREKYEEWRTAQINKWHAGADQPPWNHHVALALAWEGKPVFEGMDRLMHVLYDATDGVYRQLWGTKYDPPRLNLFGVQRLANWAAAEDLLLGDDGKAVGGLGTVVILDKERKEINE